MRSFGLFLLLLILNSNCKSQIRDMADFQIVEKEISHKDTKYLNSYFQLKKTNHNIALKNNLRAFFGEYPVFEEDYIKKYKDCQDHNISCDFIKNSFKVYFRNPKICNVGYQFTIYGYTPSKMEHSILMSFDRKKILTFEEVYIPKKYVELLRRINKDIKNKINEELEEMDEEEVAFFKEIAFPLKEFDKNSLLHFKIIPKENKMFLKYPYNLNLGNSFKEYEIDFDLTYSLDDIARYLEPRLVDMLKNNP